MRRNHIVKKLSILGTTEIRGLDLSEPLDDELIAELRELWNKSGGMLVFRNQHLTSQQHIDFSRQFGIPFGSPEGVPMQDTVSRYLHPDHPELYCVSNQVDKKGAPKGRKGAGTYWHSDVSFREEPAAASILYAKQIPSVGGDTLFADGTAAYEDLSQAMKDLLAPLYALHDFAVAAATQYTNPFVINDDLDGANKALHPVIRTHVDTGRKSIFVNPGQTSHLDGFDQAESDALLKFLYEHMTQPKYIFRQIWQEYDLAMWDNRTMMHFAIDNYGDDPRYLERVTLMGERPV